MKFWSRMLAVLLGITMICGAFVGCGGGGSKTENNTATDIQIYYWKAGYGLEFMEEIVNNFNAKQSTYTAHLEHNSNATTITSTLSLGEDNTYDLYFTMLNSMMYKSDFINLDDVLAMTPNGESKTIGQKYNQEILNALTSSVKMVPCGEDLGVNIKSVPEVMKKNDIFTAKITSIGSCLPITPVEATKTLFSSILNLAATPAAIWRQYS